MQTIEIAPSSILPRPSDTQAVMRARIGAGGFGEVYKAKWKFVTVAGECQRREANRERERWEEGVCMNIEVATGCLEIWSRQLYKAKWKLVTVAGECQRREMNTEGRGCG